MNSVNLLLVLPILVPLLGAVVIALFIKRGERLRNILVVSTAGATFISSVVLYTLEKRGVELTLTFFRLVDYGLSFRGSSLGLLLTLLASLLWLLSSLYALVYMQHEHAPGRFFAFLMATLGGCLGVFLAGDYFTLFLFFELMTFAAYPLVIHEEDINAMRAGDTYIYLSVAGGLVLLFGIIALVGVTGSADIAPIAVNVVARPATIYIIVAAFIVGFGVKAGLIPLHIWLPQAHPVAPSPASALLSGVMIKTGAYGILSVLTVTLSGKAEIANLPVRVGYVMIWVALLTMVGGAIMALMQDSIKKILAYSSVSQMGYIMLGIGVAAYLAGEGGLAFTGAIYHVFNHAVFKSGLFLMVGTVYLSTHTLSLRKLGGLYRVMPITAITTLIAALAVLGIPGVSGFISKTLLHEAILEAAHHSHSIPLAIAEKIFIFGSALTTAYFIKLYTGIFLGKYKGDALPDKGENKLVSSVLGVFATIIVVVGLFPEWVMFNVIEPVAKGTSVNMAVMHEQLHHAHLWDPHAYVGIAMPAAIGIVIFFLARRMKFFAWNFPVWMSVEGAVYRPIYRGFLYLCCRYVTDVDGGICELYNRSSTVSERMLNRVKHFDEAVDDSYDAMGQATARIVDGVRGVDQSLQGAYSAASRGVEEMTGQIGRLDRGVAEGYDRVGAEARQIVKHIAEPDEPRDPKQSPRPENRKWTVQNISLASLLVGVLLLGMLVILYIFGGNVL